MQNWMATTSACRPWALVLVPALLLHSQGPVALQEGLLAALDQPVMFEEEISRLPLERVLKHLGQNGNLEFVIDADAFEAKLGRRDVARWEISFDRVKGIPTSLFLDVMLRQIGARFEIRAGKMAIVPATNHHPLYHPACMPLEDKRRTDLMKLKLQKPVVLEVGLDKMTFGEVRQYFEDRFDITIIIDQGLFPKAAKRCAEQSVRLDPLVGLTLETVLEALVVQFGATMESRGDVVLVVPLLPRK
jgi:hypothetical protein